MLRRCIFELSSGRSFRRHPRQITAQTPSFLSSRRDFSNASKPNPSQGSEAREKASGSGNLTSKLVLGSVVVGAAVVAAYQTGYLDQFRVNNNEKHSLQSSKLDAIQNLKVAEHSGDQVVVPSEQPSELRPEMEDVLKNDEPHSLKDQESSREDVSEATPVVEEPAPVKDNELPSSPESMSLPDARATDSETSSEENVDKDTATDIKASMEQSEVPDTQILVPEETETKEVVPHHITLNKEPEDSLDHETEASSSLSNEHSVQEHEESPEISINRESTVSVETFSEEKEKASVFTNLMTEGSEDMDKSEDHKIAIDLIQAIHAAERRQAESDFHIFDEEKRKLKEKYEKELKDARARELMYAEEAAILEKELNKEKTKAAATVKLLQEKAEENLRKELQRKEEEAELQLEKVQELAKAELNAAVANEKSSQMEKIAEANLYVKALCMAFYARSEEARQSHSVHKLALGLLALEDSLSKGLPVRAEIDALYAYLEGIDRDPLLDLALSSLPEETLDYGTDTLLQLNRKFDALKGTVRHFSLIPAGGGGLLAHTVALIASSIKMRESDRSGDGIESVFNRVDNFLAEGKLAEAADALEEGVSGTQAAEAVVEWVTKARNRAVVEQGVTLLESYATCINLT